MTLLGAVMTGMSAFKWSRVFGQLQRTKIKEVLKWIERVDVKEIFGVLSLTPKKHHSPILRPFEPTNEKFQQESDLKLAAETESPEHLIEM